MKPAAQGTRRALPRTVSRWAAPRKSFGGHAVPDMLRDPYHIAAAFSYGSLCSSKRLAFAWKIDRSTARKYVRGVVVGALSRIAWEIALLERAGIRTTRILALLRRVAMRNRAVYEKAHSHLTRAA